jgi:hypothetical protein
MTTHAEYAAAHAARLRARGGKRTSVDLTAEALADLAWLKAHTDARSTSEAIASALAHTRNSIGKGQR